MWPIVTDQVAWSVCLSVCHTSKPCKMAEPSEMSFRLRTRVCPNNRELDGGPHPKWEEAILMEKRAAYCKI